MRNSGGGGGGGAGGNKKKKKKKKCVNLRRIVFLSLVEKSRPNSHGSPAREILITDAVNFERIQPLLPCPEKRVKKQKNYNEQQRKRTANRMGVFSDVSTNVLDNEWKRGKKIKKRKERKKRNTKGKPVEPIVAFSYNVGRSPSGVERD